MTESRRVLVVDDEADLRHVVQEILGAEGYDVTTAASGSEALRLMRANHFDVVTMDLRMPGLSGRDTLAMMRDVAPDAVPVVISGFLTPDDTNAVRMLGAHAVLAKPFDIDGLTATVAEAMEKARASSSPPRAEK
jgi:DNA-binding NtrC family response regulator